MEQKTEKEISFSDFKKNGGEVYQKYDDWAWSDDETEDVVMRVICEGENMWVSDVWSIKNDEWIDLGNRNEYNEEYLQGFGHTTLYTSLEACLSADETNK